MLTTHVLYEYTHKHRPHGCSFIRLLNPLLYPLNQEIFQVRRSDEFVPADIVIVERFWRPDISLLRAESLVKKIRNNRTCFVYTLDDNLLDLERSDVSEKQAIEQRMVVRYFLREADGVIVSTKFLKQRFLTFNKNIFVVPNALDERIFQKELLSKKLSYYKNNKKSKVIGYMGTKTHDKDIMMIMKALREMLVKYQGTVKLQLIGGISDQSIIQLFGELPIETVKVPCYEYNEFMAWMTQMVRWDLAIAPLEDNLFTQCKSDIKFLDYGILGIPGIYSSVSPYKDEVIHRKTGYLVQNTTESWANAIDDLLSDDILRDHIRQESNNYVSNNRTLQQCASDWQQAIMKIYIEYKNNNSSSNFGVMNQPYKNYNPCT